MRLQTAGAASGFSLDFGGGDGRRTGRRRTSSGRTVESTIATFGRQWRHLVDNCVNEDNNTQSSPEIQEFGCLGDMTASFGC